MKKKFDIIIHGIDWKKNPECCRFLRRDYQNDPLMLPRCANGPCNNPAIVTGTMVGFRPGRHKAGDPAAHDAFPQVVLHLLLLEWLRELGASRKEADATLQPGDDQHERHQRRRVRLGGLSQQTGGAAAATMDAPRRASRPAERSHQRAHGSGLYGDDTTSVLLAATRAGQNRPRDSEVG